MQRVMSLLVARDDLEVTGEEGQDWSGGRRCFGFSHGDK